MPVAGYENPKRAADNANRINHAMSRVCTLFHVLHRYFIFPRSASVRGNGSGLSGGGFASGDSSGRQAKKKDKPAEKNKTFARSCVCVYVHVCAFV